MVTRVIGSREIEKIKHKPASSGFIYKEIKI